MTNPRDNLRADIDAIEDDIARLLGRWSVSLELHADGSAYFDIARDSAPKLFVVLNEVLGDAIVNDLYRLVERKSGMVTLRGASKHAAETLPPDAAKRLEEDMVALESKVNKAVRQHRHERINHGNRAARTHPERLPPLRLVAIAECVASVESVYAQLREAAEMPPMFFDVQDEREQLRGATLTLAAGALLRRLSHAAKWKMVPDADAVARLVEVHDLAESGALLDQTTWQTQRHANRTATPTDTTPAGPTRTDAEC